MKKILLNRMVDKYYYKYSTFALIVCNICYVINVQLNLTTNSYLLYTITLAFISLQTIHAILHITTII